MSSVSDVTAQSTVSLSTPPPTEQARTTRPQLTTATRATAAAPYPSATPHTAADPTDKKIRDLNLQFSDCWSTFPDVMKLKFPEYLSNKDLLSLAQVDKSSLRIFNDYETWRKRLIADFHVPEETLKFFRIEIFKKIYELKVYGEERILNFPHGVELFDRLLNSQNLDDYLNKLTDEEFKLVLKKSTSDGPIIIPVVIAILKNVKHELNVSDLNDIFSKGYKASIAELLLQHPKSDGIDPCYLNRSLKQAVERGHFSIIKLILEHPMFSKMLITEDLGNILEKALDYNRLDIINLVLQRRDSNNLINYLMVNSEFFKNYLKDAIRIGNNTIVKLLLQNVILDRGPKELIFWAQTYDNSSIIEFILLHPKLNKFLPLNISTDIDSYWENHPKLKELLVVHNTLHKVICADPFLDLRHPYVTSTILEMSLKPIVKDAIKNNKTKPLELLLQWPDFKYIPIGYLNRYSKEELLLCYNIAKNNGLESVAKLLEQTKPLNDMFEDC